MFGNGRHMAHGGLIAALADNAMGLSCRAAARAQGRDLTGLVTASLSLDYMSRVDLGKWLGEDYKISEPLRPEHFASYEELSEHIDPDRPADE